MNPSRPFILRPVATLLCMAAILLSGLLAYRQLPLAALPQVDYPTIQVLARYPGASPELMAAAVTAPLERQFGAMAGLSQMSSTSAAGATSITLQFGLDQTLDVAEQTVQAAINAASGFLPQELPTPPVYSKVNPADAPVLTLAVTSDTLPLTALQDLVDTRLSQRIAQVSGVGLVSLGGGQRPAVRVRADPSALASMQIGLDQLRGAIAAANSNQAKGNLDGPLEASTLDANTQLRHAADYRALVVATRSGSPVRLGDVAEVLEDVENPALAAWAGLAPAILVNIQRQPGANVIEVVDAVRALLPELRGALPAAARIEVLTDRTVTIRSSVRDTQFELVLAVALVVMVILLFLRSASATLIPSLAVPLSLVGTFGVMHLAGFSLNNLTLMALTIATGFVVDDAIVMIENIARHIENGSTPRQAALDGSRQIGFTIISLTFSLIAVLIPLLFMGDVVGRLFREFAVTLAVAILISAVVSLSLTPMLAARLLRPHAARPAGAAEPWFDRVIAGYGRLLHAVLARPRAVLALALATLVATLALAWWVPKGFFPSQDTGVVQVITEGPQSAAFALMAERQQVLAERLLADPAVLSLSSIVGVDGVNTALNIGRMLVNLKPFARRTLLDADGVPLTRSESAQAVIRRLQEQAREAGGLDAYFQPVQDLTVDDRISRTAYQLIVESPDAAELERWTPGLVARLRELPELERVQHNLQTGGLKARVEIDRDAAARLGVTVAAVNDALYSAFGQRYVSTIFTQSNQYRVVLEAGGTRAGPAAIEALYVTAGDGRQVPLTAIARVVQGSTPLAVHREKQFPAVTVSFDLAAGVALGQAVAAVERVRHGLQPSPGIEMRLQGAALVFRAALGNQLFLLLAALVTMYIVLGVLYESFVHPLTILSTLPSAGVGALAALLVTRHELSVVAVIGIVLLIGITQKNAIMIIDFALDAQRRQGLAARVAIHQASVQRLRPILMTTLAALLSAVPLVLGAGPGSELRAPLGIVLIGGLLASQALTLFTTPVVYLAFDALERRAQAWRAPAADAGAPA